MRRLTEEYAANLPELLQESADATYASHGGRPETDVLAVFTEQLRQRGIKVNAASPKIQDIVREISEDRAVAITNVRPE